MRAISFFSGVGGIELGFKQAGIETIWANEIDEKAAETYRLNHRNYLKVGDIEKVKCEEIPDADIILAGFPCQSFSVAGYRKGFEDERGNVFFQLSKIIKEKKPRVVFLENVKNLISHDQGNTYRVIKTTLESYGYHIWEKVLNSCEYGNIPQNRERIYIIGFINEEDRKKFISPDPISLEKKISDIVDYNKKVDEKYYYTPEKNKFYKELKENIINKDTLYQWRRVYVRENKSKLSPTLTANMGTGGHNVPLALTKYGIRKLTPYETFMFQGYPEDFKLPDLAQSHLYKQAGNSVTVPVIKRLAESIREAIK